LTALVEAALGMAGDPRAPNIIAVLASIFGFAGGIYLATRIVTQNGLSAIQNEQSLGVVWPLRTTYALGLSLLAHVCFVLIWVAQPSTNAILALLVVWALALGMQSAAVRRLNVGGVFTTAAAATFIFLAGDLANEPLSDEERRRLTGVLASLVIGAAAGGLLLIHAPIYAALFPFAVRLGVLATAARFGRHNHAHVAPKRRRRS
jgi:hypothetical protein